MPQELINQVQSILNSVLSVLQIIATFLIAFLVVLWLTLCFWTFRDIQARTNDLIAQIFATLLVVFFNIPGVLLYVLVRPKQTLAQTYEASLQEEYMLQDLEEREICPTCRVKTQPDFLFCFNCRTRLRRECNNCGQIIKIKWSHCPYCSYTQKPKAREAAIERAGLAAARSAQTRVAGVAVNPNAGNALIHQANPDYNYPDTLGDPPAANYAADAGENANHSQNTPGTNYIQTEPDDYYRAPDPADEGGDPTIPGDKNPYARYMPRQKRGKKDTN